YIVGTDRKHRPGYADLVLDAMARAVQRGVKVRLLFDHIGTARVRGYRQLLKRLNDDGIEYYRLMPVRPWLGQYQRPDLRNHRKMLVVDGLIGYTGSINLIEPGYKRKSSYRLNRQWVDMMRSEEHTSELQSRFDLVCRLLLHPLPRPPPFPYTTLFRSRILSAHAGAPVVGPVPAAGFV